MCYKHSRILFSRSNPVSSVAERYVYILYPHLLFLINICEDYHLSHQRNLLAILCNQS
jgi:hypothetical protein